MRENKFTKEQALGFSDEEINAMSEQDQLEVNTWRRLAHYEDPTF